MLGNTLTDLCYFKIQHKFQCVRCTLDIGFGVHWLRWAHARRVNEFILLVIAVTVCINWLFFGLEVWCLCVGLGPLTDLCYFKIQHKFQCVRCILDIGFDVHWLRWAHARRVNGFVLLVIAVTVCINWLFFGLEVWCLCVGLGPGCLGFGLCLTLCHVVNILASLLPDAKCRFTTGRFMRSWGAYYWGLEYYCDGFSGTVNKILV